jgi:hypothetical protein
MVGFVPFEGFHQAVAVGRRNGRRTASAVLGVQLVGTGLPGELVPTVSGDIPSVANPGIDPEATVSIIMSST